MKFLLSVAVLLAFASVATATCPAKSDKQKCFDPNACVDGNELDKVLNDCMMQEKADAGKEADFYGCVYHMLITEKPSARTMRYISRQIVPNENVQDFLIKQIGLCESEEDMIGCVSDAMEQKCTDDEKIASEGETGGTTTRGPIETGGPTTAKGIHEKGTTPSSQFVSEGNGITTQEPKEEED